MIGRLAVVLCDAACLCHLARPNHLTRAHPSLRPCARAAVERLPLAAPLCLSPSKPTLTPPRPPVSCQPHAGTAGSAAQDAADWRYSGISVSGTSCMGPCAANARGKDNLAFRKFPNQSRTWSTARELGTHACFSSPSTLTAIRRVRQCLDSLISHQPLSDARLSSFLWLLVQVNSHTIPHFVTPWLTRLNRYSRSLSKLFNLATT